MFLLAYQRGDEAVYGEGSAGSPRWWPAHAARAMQNRVTALFDGDEAAFLSAILTGDTSGLSEEARVRPVGGGTQPHPGGVRDATAAF